MIRHLNLIIIFFTFLLLKTDLHSQSVYIKDGSIIASDTINIKDNYGLKQGTWIYPSSDNKCVKIVGFINDTIEGTLRIYSLNDAKLLHEEQYYKGKKNGNYIDFDEEGNIQLIQHYKDDKLHGYIKWYYKGKLKEDMNYKEGKKEGIYKYYHDNGNLSKLENYKNDILTGNYESYYENGQIKVEGNVNNYAPTKYYSKEGNIKEIRYYDEKGSYLKTQLFKKNGDIKKEFKDKKLQK